MTTDHGKHSGCYYTEQYQQLHSLARAIRLNSPSMAPKQTNRTITGTTLEGNREIDTVTVDVDTVQGIVVHGIRPCAVHAKSSWHMKTLSIN